MYMILNYKTGRRVEAILLSQSSERLRIIVRKSGDVEELSCLDGNWYSENGSQVEIESMIPIKNNMASGRRTLTAGN